MIQGFRKFIDLPTSDLSIALELETRFQSRGIRWKRQLHKHCGEDGHQMQWWIYVYNRDIPFARDEWNRMELQGKAKVVAIS